MDQILKRILPTNDNTQRARGFPKIVSRLHLESMKSYPKSDSVNRRTFLPNFIRIRFETTETWAIS